MSAGQDARLSELDSVLDNEPADDHRAGELFSVVDALDAHAVLRRSLSDPATPEGARKSLAHGLFDQRVGEATAHLVAEAAGLRWAGGRSFVDALERQAVRAELMAADARGELGETEDELFRFGRLVEAASGLRTALGDRSVPLSNRQQLVDDLLAGKANSSTTTLAKRAVAARERTFQNTLEGLLKLAAAHQNRAVATVRVARPLSQEQTDRLQASLSRQIGRDVLLQVVIDASVVGGIRVEIGDQVIEGTVAARLEEARRMFG